MSALFETSSINGMELANKFIRSATWEGMATVDGAVTPQLTNKMVELAQGGVGLIISGHAYIAQEGQGSPWQLGIDKDAFIPDLQKLTDAVHENGGKIFMQLAHAGHCTDKNLTHQTPLVVSHFDKLAQTERKKISKKDIERLITAYAAAAKRAQSAGFDGIQIHSAHGYLLSQFMSPFFNKRQDEYGGSIQQRTRIHSEIYQAIRQIVGQDYPIIIKMNCGDFVKNGLKREDAIQAAKLFSSMGFNAIELSGGFVRTGKLSPSRLGINAENKEAYFKDDARAIKKEISIPLILVGGVRSFGVAEKIIQDGTADYISMSRPFIREPDLINR